MAEITTYLSPNGQNMTMGSGPATRLQVATIKGMATLARKGLGEPWVYVRNSLTDRHIGSLVLEPVSGRLFAGTHENGGIWVSDDGEGESWRQTSKGLDRANVYCLAQRNDGGRVTLLAGTEPTGLYRSDDLGGNWTELAGIFRVPDTDKWTFPGPPFIPHVKALTLHPTEPRTFYALIEQGALLRTTNDGASFVELVTYSKPGELAYRDLHRLLINPVKTSELFLATGEGLYRSEDAGESWVHLMKRGELIGYPDQLFYDPFDRRTLFMAGTTKSPNDWHRTHRCDPHVLKSHDRGHSWVELENGITKPVGVSFEAMCQHVWKDGYMLALASAAGQVWTSENGGESWSAVETKLAPVAKDHHYLPFLPEQERQQWMARRQERTGIAPGRPPGADPARSRAATGN